MFDPVQDVADFHKKFGIGYRGKPRVLSFEALHYRVKFKREEVNEFEKAAEAAAYEIDKLTRSPEQATGDLAFSKEVVDQEMAKMLDALIDQVYVALGTAHQMGLDFKAGWDRVHAANMAKERRDTDGSVEDKIKLNLIKPPGWKPPDHLDLVTDNIYANPVHTP